ncbi:hypothetical protein SLEP1_g12273 [Rubroshorea leprosula]|uniref:Uncharacterized protein n=1 Tax=Rubroshorea leprosula TaxID=152421 RepID=A0AAV5IHP9_9ROSI|nr:hypothetical protein SLEP1_g12273 [Rubroshorea leprosula]
MPKQKILRVPHQLFEVNKKAYEPYVVSIGPYHRGKDHLKEMEEQKVRCLYRLLHWTNENVEIYLSAIKDMAKEARNCYSEPLDISEEEFLEMMVLDGCFIIQFLKDNLENFCYSGLLSTSIWHDLALIENQLPFFVLCQLLDRIPRTFFDSVGSTDPKRLFINAFLRAYEGKMPGLRVDTTYDADSMKNINHIVHLLHSNWHPSNKATNDENPLEPEHKSWRYIRSATELREAGIDFKVVKTKENEKSCLFDIKFEKGILEMPKVTIEDDTESLYRNLIAWEQLANGSPAFLTQYVSVMDSLINSGKDVELLCKKGIIDNWLGDDESVAVLFNRLRDHTTLYSRQFFYAGLFKDVNKHYGRTWNQWKAYLLHKYFNNPWAFISFLAATLLILLTVLQTIFTILPRQH